MKVLSFIDYDISRKEAEDKIKDTILDKYDTIYFDIDGVLLDCFSSKGEGVGAWQTQPPFKLEDSRVVSDINNNTIQLQEGIKELLDALDIANKNLGIVSRSSDRNKMLPFAALPAVMLLKKFDIYKYFNFPITIKPDITKSQYIKTSGKTLFIDDERSNIDEVNEDKELVDTLWRKSFLNWDDLYRKIYY